MVRPDWDLYFLGIARAVSLRSEDKFIRHGAVLVSENKIISCGYNGLPKGVDFIDRFDRDLRRDWTIHAETNCLFNCHSSITKNLTMYVTGTPCFPCLMSLTNFGVTSIVYIKGQAYTAEKQESEKKERLLLHSGIEVTEYSMDEVNKSLLQLL